MIRYKYAQLQRWILNRAATALTNLKLRPLLAGLKEDAVLIDCGANIGDITARFLATGGTVYAFEPDPLAYAALTARFGQHPRLQLFQQAVWTEDKKLPIYFHKDRTGDEMDFTVSSSLLKQKKNVKDESQVEVDAIDLEFFIRKLGRRVNLLKIDVEGAEIEILHSLIDKGTYKKVDLIVVETHETKIEGHDLLVAQLKQKLKALQIDNIRLNWL
jgi:FkbM family methyltransferase